MRGRVAGSREQMYSWKERGSMAVLLGAPEHSAEMGTVWEADLSFAFTSACFSLLFLAVETSLSGHRAVPPAPVQPAQPDLCAAGQSSS